MIYQKKEDKLFKKAKRTMLALVGLTSTDPINQHVRHRLACLQWELKQKYRAEGSAYYVSKKSYEEDVAKIATLEANMVQGGAFYSEALEAVKEAREYLELVAGYRVRIPDKNRVY